MTNSPVGSRNPAAGGNLGVENLVARGVEEPGTLLGEPDLDVALLTQRILAQNQPHHLHVAAAGGEIDRPQAVGFGPDVPFRAGFNKIPRGLYVSRIGGKHQRREVLIIAQHRAHNPGADELDELRRDREDERRVGIGPGVEQRLHGAVAAGGDGEVQRRLAFGHAEVDVGAAFHKQ